MSVATNEDTKAPSADVVIGGRYRVVRLLGKGGMGAVYEAENTWTKRRVAVKVMRPEVASRAEYAKRFMQEGQAATQLAHPNIVDVLDMGEDPELGSLYIVQAFLTGHDLRAHLDAAGRMPVRAALDLITPVMGALVMAHGRGIVHRDLKPDNIFLAETPRGVVPTLIDFGIAKVVSDDGGSKTSTGLLMGTPYYMAPEQAQGDSALDARADVWSLGVVLYELLSGMRPATAANSNALIAKIIYEDPMPLADAAPELPADVTAAVMGALQRDVAARYPTMQAFLDALLACEVMAADAPADTRTSAPSSLSSAPSATPTPARTPVPAAVLTPVPSTSTSTPTPTPTVGESERLETLAPQEVTSSGRPRAARMRMGYVLVGAVAVVALVVVVARGVGTARDATAPAGRPASTVAVPVTTLRVESPPAPTPAALTTAPVEAPPPTEVAPPSVPVAIAVPAHAPTARPVRERAAHPALAGTTAASAHEAPAGVPSTAHPTPRRVLTGVPILE